MAKVVLTPEALEQLSQLPRVIRERVIKLIERLRHWPDVSGVKPLSGDLAGWFRMRTGDYRLRFRVEGQKIIIDRIGHRKDIYDA
jgi:mRNA interferase RelE/StbE